MNKKIAIAFAAFTGVALIAGVIQFYGSEAALIERFPDLDPKQVMKAHRHMVGLALKQDPRIANITEDGEYDELLRNIVKTYNQ